MWNASGVGNNDMTQTQHIYILYKFYCWWNWRMSVYLIHNLCLYSFTFDMVQFGWCWSWRQRWYYLIAIGTQNNAAAEIDFRIHIFLFSYYEYVYCRWARVCLCMWVDLSFLWIWNLNDVFDGTGKWQWRVNIVQMAWMERKGHRNITTTKIGS